MPVVALDTSRSRSASLPNCVRIVEPDQPCAVRCVQCQRIAEPVWPMGAYLGRHYDELHPVACLIHKQCLAVKIQQRVESGVAAGLPRALMLSVSDN